MRPFSGVPVVLCWLAPNIFPNNLTRTTPQDHMPMHTGNCAHAQIHIHTSAEIKKKKELRVTHPPLLFLKVTGLSSAPAIIWHPLLFQGWDPLPPYVFSSTPYRFPPMYWHYEQNWVGYGSRVPPPYIKLVSTLIWYKTIWIYEYKQESMWYQSSGDKEERNEIENRIYDAVF